MLSSNSNEKFPIHHSFSIDTKPLSNMKNKLNSFAEPRSLTAKDKQYCTANTRNNKYLLKIPKQRTGFAKKSARIMAAKMYNHLPIETRKEPCFSLFSDKLNTPF